MKNMSQITDSEWIIMKVIWDSPPHTSADIIKNLSQEVDWKPTTIKTLISRLVNKSIVGVKKEGRKHFYYPVLSEEECIKCESKTFLQKIYGGAIKPMLLNFIENENLSDDDIEELKALLDKKKK